jgi:ORF6N domain
MKELILNKQNIQNLIYTIRGAQVMLDSDLAELYQVETRMLNQAVKRNRKRFPVEFMFQLNKEEYKNISDRFLISQIVTSKNNDESLRSQIATSKEKHGGR